MVGPRKRNRVRFYPPKVLIKHVLTHFCSSGLLRIENLIATSEDTISTANDMLHEADRIETANYSRIKLFVENQINSARIELAQALRLVALDQSNNQVRAVSLRLIIDLIGFVVAYDY